VVHVDVFDFLCRRILKWLRQQSRGAENRGAERRRQPGAMGHVFSLLNSNYDTENRRRGRAG
jgi:hypothetical protein